MEERNMQLDDDGKIKMRKNREALAGDPEQADDEIVIDVPDFAEFRDESENVGLSGDELAEKNELYEQYVANRKTEADKIFAEAETLYEAGEYESAGEKYLDCVAAHGGNWRAWFGIVRVQTKDLTDFSEIYECQNAYNRALKRAGKSGKAELAERYGGRLQAKIKENAERAQSLEQADEAFRASRRGELEAAENKSRKPFIVSCVCFLIVLVGGIVLSSLVNTVSGVQILIPAILADACAAIALVLALMCFKRFYAARAARRKNESNLSTEEGKNAAALRAENELIQSILEDFHS